MPCRAMAYKASIQVNVLWYFTNRAQLEIGQICSTRKFNNFQAPRSPIFNFSTSSETLTLSLLKLLKKYMSLGQVL